jgi:hypothetical protein
LPKLVLIVGQGPGLLLSAATPPQFIYSRIQENGRKTGTLQRTQILGLHKSAATQGGDRGMQIHLVY